MPNIFQSKRVDQNIQGYGIFVPPPPATFDRVTQIPTWIGLNFTLLKTLVQTTWIKHLIVQFKYYITTSEPDYMRRVGSMLARLTKIFCHLNTSLKLFVYYYVGFLRPLRCVENRENRSEFKLFSCFFRSQRHVCVFEVIRVILRWHSLLDNWCMM